jgi:hypothetical protein
VSHSRFEENDGDPESENSVDKSTQQKLMENTRATRGDRDERSDRKAVKRVSRGGVTKSNSA